MAILQYYPALFLKSGNLQLWLPYLANIHIWDPVKFEFQINEEWVFSIIVYYFMGQNYTKKHVLYPEIQI